MPARNRAALSLPIVLVAVLGCGPQGLGRGKAGAQAGPPIKLSAAVALPQNMPAPSGQSGTVIMCSVDYRWTSGGVEPGASYLWRIEWAGGRHADIPVEVRSPRGTLETILREVRPDEGPFSCQIVERTAAAAAEPRSVSNVAPMR